MRTADKTLEGNAVEERTPGHLVLRLAHTALESNALEERASPVPPPRFAHTPLEGNTLEERALQRFPLQLSLIDDALRFPFRALDRTRLDQLDLSADTERGRELVLHLLFELDKLAHSVR